MRQVFKSWVYYKSVQKRKSRLAAYTRNKLHRAKMRRLFESWRGVSHELFKSRIEHEKVTFREEVESTMCTTLNTKVNSLLLYMAELEDKIKLE